MSELNERLRDQLKELTSIVALPGYEDTLIRYVKKELQSNTKSVEVDNLGNVIVQINETSDSNPYRVMVFAHMDELGFVVRKIEENGFLRLERLGGIPEKSMLGQTVVIDTPDGMLKGVIGTKSHHVTKPEEKFKVPTVNDIYADFGFRSKEDAIYSHVNVGTPVAYSRQFFYNDSIVFSNSIDNRVGCLVLIELVRRLLDKELSCELYLVFSVQEEFNLRGILPAVRKVNPNLAVGLDIAVTGDTPDLKELSDIRLGGGPCLCIYNFHGRGTLGGLIPNPKLVNFISKIASDNGIPLQRFTFMGGLTDTSFSQLENKGIPMVDLAFPVRYTHAPIEAVDLNDVAMLIDLLELLLPLFNEEVNLSRG